METIRERADYRDAQHLKDYVRGWLPCLLPITEELQDDFLSDLTEVAADLYGSKDGSLISIPYDKVVMYLENL